MKKNSTTKFKPKHGYDYDIAEAQTRGKISYILLSGSALTLLISALHCYQINDFTGLEHVWTFVSPVVFGVTGYYLNK